MNTKGQDNIEWPDYIVGTLFTYRNQMKHSATGFTLMEARKAGNQFNPSNE